VPAIELIQPGWPAGPGLSALATTRAGGVSCGPFASFNLGDCCGDDPGAVAENRRRLAASLPSAPCWLKQVHGTDLIHLDDWQPGIEADAAWTDRPDQVAAVLAADCLPLLFADRREQLVAVVHAGWRGLASGVVERAVAGLPVAPERLLAWIGPGISQAHYEVSDEVRAAFGSEPDAFARNERGRWQADLKAIARVRLSAAGVGQVIDSGLCTAADRARFFSYRRDHGQTGRQASLIWLRPAE
jgi:YfiH family protein